VSLLFTKHPETQAPRSFKTLVGKIAMVKTLIDYQGWIQELK
jgi:hypothetical protein